MPTGGGEESSAVHDSHDGGDPEQTGCVYTVLPVEHDGSVEVCRRSLLDFGGMLCLHLF